MTSGGAHAAPALSSLCLQCDRAEALRTPPHGSACATCCLCKHCVRSVPFQIMLKYSSWKFSSHPARTLSLRSTPDPDSISGCRATNLQPMRRAFRGVGTTVSAAPDGEPVTGRPSGGARDRGRASVARRVRRGRKPVARECAQLPVSALTLTLWLTVILYRTQNSEAMESGVTLK